MKKRIILREYVISSFGAFLTSLGLVCFLIPNNIACGGASGIAVVLSNIIPLSVGLLMYLINAILFLFSFIFIGKEFGIRSIFCTFLLTFFVDIFERFKTFPRYSGDDLFVAVFLGVAISAVGMAITFSQNSSTGGTDIVARILNKYTGMAMGISLLFVDLLVGISAGMVFDVRTGMYSIISVIFNGITIDYVLKLLDNNVTLTIISKKHFEIAEYIMKNLQRGASYLKGTGAYSTQEKNFLYVALKKREMAETVKAIRRFDPDAFIISHEASHIIGEGFKNINKVF